MAPRRAAPLLRASLAALLLTACAAVVQLPSPSPPRAARPFLTALGNAAAAKRAAAAAEVQVNQVDPSTPHPLQALAAGLASLVQNAAVEQPPKTAGTPPTAAALFVSAMVAQSALPLARH